MTDENDETFAFTLSKDELPLYRVYLREAGWDPDRYLSGRRVKCPPEHFAELAITFAHVNSEDIMADLQGGEGTGGQLMSQADKLMRKVAQKASEQGMTHELERHSQKVKMEDYDEGEIARLRQEADGKFTARDLYQYLTNR